MRFDSTSEKKSVGRMIRGNPTIILPSTPGTKSMGANAAMVVSTPNVTGTRTCCVPLIAPLVPLPVRN